MTPEATAVYVANGNNWRLDTIVLDAGHGGRRDRLLAIEDVIAED